MFAKKVTFDTNGRIAIPAKMRKLLHLNPGDDVILKYEEGQITLTSYAHNIEKVRNIVQKYTNRSLLEELKDLRKEDAERE